MNKTQTVLPTGILAGVVATLLVMGAGTQSSFAAVLYAASALPIFIAGLGWGNRAAITGIVTSGILGAVLISPIFAVTMAIFTLIPAGWLSHLANLARPASELGGPDNLLAWYPISDILMHLCGLVTIAVIALGVAIGYGPELVGQIVDVLGSALQTQEPGLSLTAADIGQLKSTMLLTLPMVQGGIWVILLFAAFYFAMRIVSRSGRALRPRENMPSALRMNRHAIYIFLAGIVMTFLGGVAAMIGATICGTFGAGFLMSGFAAIHFRSQGKDWRLPVLVLAYFSSMLVIPAFAILALGLTDTRRTIALTPAKGSTDQNTTNPDN